MCKTTSSKIRIISLEKKLENLYWIKTERPQNFNFESGQFVRITPFRDSIESAKTQNGWRAQSIISSPTENFLEFLIMFDGNTDFGKNFEKLEIDSHLIIEEKNYGYLTLDRFQNSGDLWLFSTGSGIAPFLSIIKDFERINQFDKLILIHSVRTLKDLSCYEIIDSTLKNLTNTVFKRSSYLPIITREFAKSKLLINGEEFEIDCPNKRIPLLLESGQLEFLVKCKLSLQKSKIMICGNPEMIKQTRTRLKEMGFKNSRKNSLGQIAVENFW